MIPRQTKRIYFPSPLSVGGVVILQEEVDHYVRNVLRIKAHEKLRLFNEKNGEFLVAISQITKKEIHMLVEAKIRDVSYNLPTLTLGLCMIKNDRFSTALDMAVQLGVTKIIPLVSQYTIHKNFNWERARRIIIEAAEQSERLSIPDIRGPIKLADIPFNEFDCTLYANEREEAIQIMPTEILQSKTPLLIVGPEGGFSEEEVQFIAEQKNTYSVTLGENILRSETACCKLISYVQLIRDKACLI